MQADYALILAAGFGTRMKSIGTILPKVLWPVGEFSLLEIQIMYLKKLGIKNIYINVHHQAEEIKRHIRVKGLEKSVTFLDEFPEILDIGGAIHNLARRPEINYLGKLLIINADQFCTVDNNFELGDFDIKLLCFKTTKSSGYNKINHENLIFSGVVPNNKISDKESYLTFTGVSLVNLSKLTKTIGPSNFFKSVASTDKKISLVLIKEDYWDFGTLERYFINCKKIFGHTDSSLYKFLVEINCIDPNFFDKRTLSYKSDRLGVINFSKKINPVCGDHKVIISCDTQSIEQEIKFKSGVIYNHLFEEVSLSNPWF